MVDHIPLLTELQYLSQHASYKHAAPTELATLASYIEFALTKLSNYHYVR